MKQIDIKADAQDLLTFAQFDLAENGGYIRSFKVEDLIDFWVESFWADMDNDPPTEAEKAQIEGLVPEMSAELARLGVPS